jgi:hypothetical protein
MPKEGIFAVVRQGGEVARQDPVKVIKMGDGTTEAVS